MARKGTPKPARRLGAPFSTRASMVSIETRIDSPEVRAITFAFFMVVGLKNVVDGKMDITCAAFSRKSTVATRL